MFRWQKPIAGLPRGRKKRPEGLGTTDVARTTGSNVVIYMAMLDFLIRRNLIFNEAAQGQVSALRKRSNDGAERQTWAGPSRGFSSGRCFSPRLPLRGHPLSHLVHPLIFPQRDRLPSKTVMGPKSQTSCVHPHRLGWPLARGSTRHDACSDCPPESHQLWTLISGSKPSG